MREWNTENPVALQAALESFADYVDKALRRLSATTTWAGRNPSVIRPGQYVEASHAGDQTVLLQKPASTDVWKESAVRKTEAAGTLTVQGSACTLNGVVDGTATLSTQGILWFMVVPTAGGQALEWVTR